MTLKRRTFIKLGVATGLTGTASLVLPRASHNYLLNELLEVLPDLEDAVWVGEQYLDHVPKEADIHWLSEHIFKESYFLSTLKSEDEFRKHILNIIHNDFLEERVFELDGWILSITELRICAILHLGTQNA